MRRQTCAALPRSQHHAGKRHTHRRNLAMLLAGLFVFSALAADAAFAKGAPVQPRGTEVCWIDPNPSTNGVWYTVYGMGFKPGQMVNVFVQDQYSTGILMAQADTAGNWLTGKWTQFVYTGTKNVTIYQMGDRRKTVLATCMFQVN